MAAITVLNRPDGLCLAGNLPKLVLTADEEVRVRLKVGDDTLLDETYMPDKIGRISLDLTEPVKATLSFTIPTADVFHQASLVKTFTLHIDSGTGAGTYSDTYTFTAIRSGVKALSITPSEFLQANFLTWQEQTKKVSYNQPEWLSYYAVNKCYLYITAYFADKTSAHLKLATFTAGSAYTVNMQFGRFTSLFPKQPVYIDAYMVGSDSATGTRLSYIQRYLLDYITENEQYFCFDNSLGGIDTLRATGELKAHPEYTSETALMGDTEESFSIEKKDVKTQNTGWLTKAAAAWLQDMFSSLRVLHHSAGALQAVVVENVTAETSTEEHLTAFEFDYRPAVASPYLNVVRNHAALAEPLQIVSPDSGLFFLAPRLIDFPDIVLGENTIIPVQSAFSETWFRTSYGGMMQDLMARVAGSAFGQSAHTHNNFPVLASLGTTNKAGYDYITINHREAAAVFADKAADADRWQGWRRTDYLDQAVRKNDEVNHLSISAPTFVSGFSGEGWRIDKEAGATFDNLTVRKEMSVYSLLVQQIRANNGSLWVSDSAKITEVVEADGCYLCEVDTDGGALPIPFMEGDWLRCQRWTGKDIKYYTAKVIFVNQDTFILSDKDGAGIPAAGDELVRIGNVSNPDRQGALYLTASDNYAPYLDVIDGVISPDLAGRTKVRLGKLEGIVNSIFAEALKGYGLYSNNAYLLGDFRLRTGEDVRTKFEVVEGMLQSAMQSVIGSITNKDNYLTNATFSQDMSSWERESDMEFFDVGGALLDLGPYFYSQKNKVADIAQFDGRFLLRIKRSYIKQLNANITKPDTDSVIYLTIKYHCTEGGDIVAGFAESAVYLEQAIAPAGGFQTLEVSGAWDGFGDFLLSFTGDIYIEQLTLTNHPLEDYRREVSSLFEQTAEHIKAVVTEVDSLDKTIRNAGWITSSDGNKLWATKEQVGDLGQSLSTHTGSFHVTAEVISGMVTAIDSVNNTISSAGWITTTDGNKLWASKELEDGKKIISYINQTAEQVTINADKIKLEGHVTANGNVTFTKEGRIIAVDAELSGKITAESGRLGGFNIIGYGLTNDFDTDLAYIVFRYDPEKIFAGIGTNVFSQTTGMRVAARFENENTRNEYGSNIALSLSAQNAKYNFAILAKGAIVTNGLNIGFGLNRLTLVGGTTTIDIKYGTNILIVCNSSSYTTAYLPTIAIIQAALNISSSTDFCITLNIMADLACTTNYRLWGADYVFYDSNGNVNNGSGNGYLDMGRGDAVIAMIARVSGVTRAYLINYRN